ncbi:hypothetical protein EV127DRAFT_343165 [Xylaria flabelliformis]|nr:hypothetical protein EV127DRAFT_343165 [Xylaria flabelliformis]
MASDLTRDLRSGAQETKRVKDHNHKWARGKRPSPGVKSERFGFGSFLTGSPEQQEKVRPCGKHIRSPNVTKPHTSHGFCMVPEGYWAPKSDILVELQDPVNMSSSLRDLLPSPYTQRKQSIADDFLYSFDKAESPGKPLPLEVFVKTNTKATEKFVEKEYEILDYHGNIVKGRKALKDVHRGKAAPPSEEVELIEDDGFELV